MYGTLVGKEKEGKVWSKYWTRRKSTRTVRSITQKKGVAKRNKKGNRR
jgi:hypothetical protein